MDSLSRKKVREYIYHMETLEDVIDISKEAEIEFRDAMTGYNESALQALSPKEGDPKPKKVEDDESVNFEDKSFKKLFRKLAVKCHPDKLNDSYSDREKEFLKGCYEGINKANDTYDWGLLLKVAIDLDVEFTDLSEEHLNNISENIDKLKSKIERYEQSMAYKWFTLSDPTIRDAYLKSCADIFMKSLGE